MSTTTALDIIKGALRVLQVANPDVTISSEEANDALDGLNLMIDGWSNESLMLYHVTKEFFTLTPNQQSYTIGIGGNFNTNRPIAIEYASLTYSGNSEAPVSIVAYDDWAAIQLKTIAAYPNTLYLDDTYPLASIYLYPIPNSAQTLTLYSRKALTQFPNLTSTFSLPPGYARAMKFQLALELAPEYQVSAGNDVIAIAASAKQGLKRTNKRLLTKEIDVGLINSNQTKFNIYRGF